MKTQLHVWILLTLFASTALAQSNSPAQPNASSQSNAQTRAPVIDVHMHAFAKDPRWDHKVGNPITGREIISTNEQAHMRETLAEMKKYKAKLHPVLRGRKVLPVAVEEAVEED